MVDDSCPQVANYFVSAGLNDLKKPECDAETLEPITDLAVIFKSLGEEPPPGYTCIETTPNGLTADLNHGSIRTPPCFICYRRGRDKPPLTDIGVLYEGKQRLMHGCDIVHKTPTKQVANVNNGSNMRIFITYRRASPQFAHSSLAVIEICVVIANKGEKPPHAFCLIEKNLNQGLVGSEVYLCYRKSLARTNSLSYPAEMISRYPSVDCDAFPLPDEVALFCMPLGAVVECWPEKSQPPLPIFSTFALTDAKGEKIYGAGVTFFEELQKEKFTDDVYKLIQQQKKNHRGEKKLVAQTNKSICLLSRYPFFDAFRRFLMSLYRLTVSGKQSIPIERYISHFMRNVPFPTPQKPIVYVQITHEGFELQEPSRGPLPVSGASFTALLRCLGTDNTLVLLYCILTEQKILVHSLRPALLTSVGEALTSLIFPFQWKCPYIPLCPLKLAEVLFAPFPFIYGIDSRYFDQSSPPKDVTCVDLDTNMITQAVDPKESKSATWKSLPKKPGKVIKDRLDELFLQLYQVANEDSNTAVEMAPLDDLSSAKKKNYIEVNIREAFLRFHAQILKGYKQFLLPITSRPDIGSRDLTTLFDLQGFVRSRPRGTERFFQLLTRTQLFSHFIETRSLSSSNDAVLAFFDECTEKCETNARLLHSNVGSESFTTVVVTGPDLSGLPPGEMYKYNGFPKLREDLFAAMNPTLLNLKSTNTTTPPRSPMVGRTIHERQQGSISAKKQANSPTLWARCLLGHCYTIWFIHLPAYVKFHYNKENILWKAFEVLQKISETKAKLPDEVCYRVLMQLSGQFDHPALAVKVLFEMKRVGIQPNAVTWGFYHRAVLDGKWLPEKIRRSPKQLWNRLRIALMAMHAFQKTIMLKRNNSGKNLLINLSDSDENLRKDANLLIPLETSSVGTGSDGGYSSGLLSTEDLSRQQPVAGGLIDLGTALSDLSINSHSNQDLSAVKSHRRNFSMSSQTSESDNEFTNAPASITRTTRRLSETSIGSNLSNNVGNNNSHIIVCHDGSWQDLGSSSHQGSASDLYDEIGPPSVKGVSTKSDIALEAVICSCQICTTCDKVIYDEEVMGAWSADDSNLNILCPFCQAKRVPNLQIKVKDYRGLASKKCSSGSLSSDVSCSNVNDTKSSSNPLLTRNINVNNDTASIGSTTSGSNASESSTHQLEQFFSSAPAPSKAVSIKPTKKLSRDMIISSSAPTSASSSPVLGSGGRRPAFFKHRKSSSTSSNFNMFLGTPEEKMVTSVPYLSPLVLRKELENMLENNGDSKLQTTDIVNEKPILYWNLVWYFHRLGLHSHLPSFLLHSYSSENEDSNNREVVVSTSWDVNRQTEHFVPLYMLWNVPDEKQDLVAERGWTPRSLLTAISVHVQKNDVVNPMKILLDERSRQQNQNAEVHWSLYRELLFLSLLSCGAENIDVDAFDREYKKAYKEVAREYSERLYPDDKSPTIKAVFCRQAFEAPTLQPRKAQLY